MSDPDDKLMPRPQGGFSAKRFISGARRSQRRLATLGFDPIEKLVNLYKTLEEEHNYYVNLREANVQINEMTASGKIKKTHRYSGVAHAAVLSNMEKVSNDLMRYAYGRVPEGMTSLDKPVGAMIVQLNDKNSVTINGKASEEIEEGEYSEFEDDMQESG